MTFTLAMGGCATAGTFEPGGASAQQFSADQLRCRQWAAGEAGARADAADRGGDGEGGTSEIGAGLAGIILSRNDGARLFNACMRRLGYDEIH